MLCDAILKKSLSTNDALGRAGLKTGWMDEWMKVNLEIANDRISFGKFTFQKGRSALKSTDRQTSLHTLEAVRKKKGKKQEKTHSTSCCKNNLTTRK